MDQGIEEGQLTAVIGNLASFNRLMGIDQQICKLEFRMEIVVEALELLRNQLPKVESSFKDGKIEYVTLLKTFSALQIIQTLIHDRNPYEQNRVLTDKDNFSSSILVLLQHGRVDNPGSQSKLDYEDSAKPSFIQLIARLVRCMVLSQEEMVPKEQDQIGKLAYLQNSSISISVACLTAVC